MREESDHKRLIIRKMVTEEECREMEFIHKSCSVVGYRPNVFSTTLSHLISTNSPHFILPFLPIRERLKEKVEEFFGCEFELFVEFTGLISWTRGASIGWHSDDNRPYLKQRDFTAVCYLNSYEKDFKGGLFHFQDGEPTTLVPMAGDVAMYTADSRNIHSVDEIIEGERLTLTLWFSRDRDHDEDVKLISLLSENMLHVSNDVGVSKLPLPASSNMYWFSSDDECHQRSGFDICCARMHALGFDVYSSQVKSSTSDFTEILMGPLQLAKENHLFVLEFTNILHALQVVQFYSWKASELSKSRAEVEPGKVVQLSQSHWDKIITLQSLVLKDLRLAEMVFGCMTCNEKHSLDWGEISAAVSALENYSIKLHKDLQMSLPYWRTEQMIYCVPLSESSYET